MKNKLIQVGDVYKNTETNQVVLVGNVNQKESECDCCSMRMTHYVKNEKTGEYEEALYPEWIKMGTVLRALAEIVSR